IVLPDSAAVFVDGRYTLQAEAEVDARLFARRHVTGAPPAAWIAQSLKPGQKLGYDPRLTTLGEVERYGAAAAKAGGSLVALLDNPVDAVWKDRRSSRMNCALPASRLTRSAGASPHRSARAKPMPRF